jgi:hypothetical protein
MMRVAVGLVSVGWLAGMACFAPAMAQSSSWNGTWAGNWAHGDGAQIIFAGDEAIGIYWRGDYLGDTHAALSRGGAVVTISWESGQAVLTRDGPTTAHVVIHEKGRADASFALKKDD